MRKIKTLKDKGEVFYPQTHIEAVVDDNGNTVTDLIDKISREIAPLETEVEELGNKVAELENLSGGSADIPLATTENDGLMSANDKETLVSLPIRLGDVNVINLEQSQFSNLIWNGTKFVHANNNYNSYILRIPEQTPLTVSASVGGKSYYVFKESPYVEYSTQDVIKVNNWSDYPEGFSSGYGYLVIQINLTSSSYDVVVTLGEYGLGKRISILSKKIDEEIVPTINKMTTYETESTFNAGYILPNSGNLTVSDNQYYVHTLMNCVEGQRFIVSAKASAAVFAWQFLDVSNNIHTKYEGGTEPVVEAEIIAPSGAKKLLVNSVKSFNPSVKFWNSNNPENALSKEIKEASDKIEEIEEAVGAFNNRIINVEDECNNIKGIVGEPSSTIDLTVSNYSGLVYNGTKFSSASTNPKFDSFIFPLTQGNTYKIIDNTSSGYNSVGLFSIYTFSDTPAIGEIGYVRKLDDTKILKSFTPQDDERYLLLNIDKLVYIDNNFTYISEPTGIFERVEGLEENFSKLLQGKTVLCLGDSITEFRYQDKRYSDYLADITGANVINGGIGGTMMSRRADIPSSGVFAKNSEAYACLDLPSIAHALNTGNFTMQEAAAQWLISDSNADKTSDDNTAIIDTLKSVDLNSVDIVTIFIGTNDIGKSLGTIGASGNDTTALDISQGFYEIIKNLLTKNPNLRIYYFCPMPRYYGTGINTFDPSSASTDENWCDNLVINGVKFPDMVDHQIKLAQYYKIPVCDMYRTLGINPWNIKSLMRLDINDGTHPYKGFKMLANKIASFIAYNNNLNI